MLAIQEILDSTGGRFIQGDHSEQIEQVHFDSRRLEANSLFIALTGGNTDGHNFLHAAKEKGAVAALISRTDITTEGIEDLTLILVEDTEKALQELASYYRKKLDIPIIAITGSNGKTTTKDMISHILASKFSTYKTKGNLNNHLGLPLSLLQIQKHHQVAVLELGMNHAGEIDFLASIAKPSISIITNIGDSHIEHLGSRENIAKAKGELLPHTDPKHFILLNKDDTLATSLRSMYDGKTYFFSTETEADIYASDIQINDNGTSFQLHIDTMVSQCFIPMFGIHNVSNVLSGAFIANHLGISLEGIVASLLHLSSSDMRFEIINGPNESVLINDAYNASPSSMKASIHTFLQMYPQRKKVVVLGDIFELGGEAERLHVEVGDFLKDKEITLITVGKDSEFISKQASGKHFTEKEDAIKELKKYLHSEHAILFKASRGMKLEEMIKKISQ